eukprot:2899940-Rhodomonas_salina.1
MTTTCSGHGRCASSDEMVSCHCFPGWSGDRCSVCVNCRNGTVVTLGLTQGDVESFTRILQMQMVRGLAKLTQLDPDHIEYTALALSGNSNYPLIIQLVLYASGEAETITLLRSWIATAANNGAMGTAIQEEGLDISVRLEAALTEARNVLPDPLHKKGLPDEVPHVSALVRVRNESVETFNSQKQHWLKTAVGDHLGLSAADLE